MCYINLLFLDGHSLRVSLLFSSSLGGGSFLWFSWLVFSLSLDGESQAPSSFFSAVSPSGFSKGWTFTTLTCKVLPFPTWRGKVLWVSYFMQWSSQEKQNQGNLHATILTNQLLKSWLEEYFLLLAISLSKEAIWRQNRCDEYFSLFSQFMEYIIKWSIMKISCILMKKWNEWWK